MMIKHCFCLTSFRNWTKWLRLYHFKQNSINNLLQRVGHCINSPFRLHKTFGAIEITIEMKLLKTDAILKFQNYFVEFFRLKTGWWWWWWWLMGQRRLTWIWEHFHKFCYKLNFRSIAIKTKHKAERIWN